MKQDKGCDAVVMDRSKYTEKCLKLVSTIFYQVFIFSPNYSPSKTMRNIFYFI